MRNQDIYIYVLNSRRGRFKRHQRIRRILSSAHITIGKNERVASSFGGVTASDTNATTANLLGTICSLASSSSSIADTVERGSIGSAAREKQIAELLIEVAIEQTIQDGIEAGRRDGDEMEHEQRDDHVEADAAAAGRPRVCVVVVDE